MFLVKANECNKLFHALFFKANNTANNTLKTCPQNAVKSNFFLSGAQSKEANIQQDKLTFTTK